MAAAQRRPDFPGLLPSFSRQRRLRLRKGLPSVHTCASAWRAGRRKEFLLRGKLRRLALPLAALCVLVVASTAGGASKATTLVFAGAADPTYLDPALVSDGESFRVTEQIFESLVKLKPGTTLIQPALAKSWGSKNAKDWTFSLLHNVKFHDGTPFNAAAVC